MSTALDIGTIEQVDRYEAVLDWFQQDGISMDFVLRKEFGLRGKLSSRALGSIIMPDMMIEGADASIVRPARARTTMPAKLFVNLGIAGVGALRQSNREVVVRAGEIALTSTKYNMEALQHRSSHHVSFVIPYDALGLPHSLVDSLLAVNLMQRSPIAQLVANFFHDLSVQQTFNDDSLLSLAVPVVDMVRALVTTSGAAGQLSAEPLAHTLYPRLVEYIRLHAFEQNLNAARIARDHGVSVRYLYAVLARENVSLGDWIRQIRVEKAAALLVEFGVWRSIAEVAYATGYADQAHFSRSFRRRYDMTPSEWRQIHRVGDPQSAGAS